MGGTFIQLRMSWQFIEFKVEGNIGWIFLNRPQRGNSITPEMGVEIQKAITICDNDINVRAVAIQGNGKYFCTGMDLGGSNQQNLEEDIKSGVAAERSLQLFRAVKSCKKPTIAVVNGPIYGGGCGLLFACDIRICVPGAFLCFSEVKRGIVPALISAIIVPQLGEYLSNVYMMTGMKLPVEKLYQLGLVSELVSKEDLRATVEKYVAEINTCAPGAVANTKKNVQFCAGNTDEDNFEHVKDVFMNTVHSDEAMYGISCFVQKKQPDWSSFHAKL